MEYCPIPDVKNLVKLPDNIGCDVGAMLACSGLTTYSMLKK